MENHGERTFQVHYIIKINEMRIDTSFGNRGSIQLVYILVCWMLKISYHMTTVQYNMNIIEYLIEYCVLNTPVQHVQYYMYRPVPVVL